MQSTEHMDNLQRRSRFEAFEERLALSAEPVADFFLGIGEQLEQPYGDMTALSAAHDLTGLNHVRETYGLQGRGQTVVIIDSGVAYDHVALGGGLGSGYRVVGGWDFAENDADPYDDGPAGFHGTHVAGIVGSADGTYPGVAPEVDLVALRVFDDQGRGQLAWVEQALRWVHANRDAFPNPITTVNLSLGTKWNSSSVPSWAQLEDEFALLKQDGIFIAVAAGNSFREYQTVGLSYPAASPYVVPVASVENDGTLSAFSQRDPRVLAAPGRSITSTVPDHVYGGDGIANDFGSASGTSMASPYVAGASVLVREAMQMVGYVGINQDLIYDHLRNTAQVFYDTATNADYFRIDVRAAIDSLLSPTDDYGSTAATAHSLGTLTGTTRLSGQIERSGDVDFFTFVAGQTGTARLNLQSASGLQAVSQVVGVDSTLAQGARTFEVVAGQRYTFSVSAQSGTGAYDFSLSLTTSITDLGRIEFTTLNSQQLRAGETWFQVTASRDGLLTAEASFNRGAGNLNLQLYDSAGQMLTKSVSTTGAERLDATVVAGGKYLLKVNGTNARVDFRLTNLITLRDGHLQAFGTGGNDAFVFYAANAGLSVNGVQYNFNANQLSRVTLDGRGGSDSLVFHGSAADEHITLRPGSMTAAGLRYSFQATSMEQVQASGGGGRNTVSLYDSAGADRFVATPEKAEMSGAGYRHEALQFQRVFAYASSGMDVAELYDTAGNDTLRAEPSLVTLSGANVFYSAAQFDQVIAYATRGGDDVARFYDSPGNDTFVADPTSATLSGAGFSNTARGFDRTFAFATRGGYDTARLEDSSGDDTFFADSFTATLSGRGFSNSAQHFDLVAAHATRGGYDTARLYDSPSADTLVANANGVTLSGTGYQREAYGFERVYATSTRGGRDVARLDALARSTTSLVGNFSLSITGQSVVTAQTRLFQRAAADLARQSVISGLETAQTADSVRSLATLHHYLCSNSNTPSRDLSAILTQAKQDAASGQEEGRVDYLFESWGD